MSYITYPQNMAAISIIQFFGLVIIIYGLRWLNLTSRTLRISSYVTAIILVLSLLIIVFDIKCFSDSSFPFIALGVLLADTIFLTLTVSQTGGLAGSVFSPVFPAIPAVGAPLMGAGFTSVLTLVILFCIFVVGKMGSSSTSPNHNATFFITIFSLSAVLFENGLVLRYS